MAKLKCDEGTPLSVFPGATKALVISLALILLSRLLLAIFCVNLAGDDGARYLREGINLSTYRVFSSEVSENPSPNAHDLPVYPCILAGIHWFSGDYSVTARSASILNAFFFTFAAFGVYRIYQILIGEERSALIALWVFASLPESVPYSVFHMPESFFLAVFVWSQFLLIKFIKFGGAPTLISSFGLLGVCILTKPIVIFYPAFAGFLVLAFAKTMQISSRVRSVLVGIIVVVLTICPWLLRNWLVFDVPGMSTITGTNLFDYNYRFLLEDRYGSKAQDILESERDRILAGKDDNLFAKANALGDFAKSGILNNLPDYIVLTIKRHPRLYFGTGNIAFLNLIGSPSSKEAYERTAAKGSYPSIGDLPMTALILQLGGWLILLIVYTLSAAGLFTIFQRKDWFILLLIGGGIAYFGILIGPVTNTRYRLAMNLFLAVLAGIGWTRARHGTSREKPFKTDTTSALE